MCWVACDRLARIAARLGLGDRAAHWQGEAQWLRNQILSRAWNERKGVLAGALDHSELDASVLLLPELGLLPAALSTRMGSEAQRPLAIVVVGGMVMTLILANLVPVLYSFYGHREPPAGAADMAH